MSDDWFWTPMMNASGEETAPKDGTLIDVWVGYRGGKDQEGRPSVGWREVDVKWNGSRWVRMIEEGDYAGDEADVEYLIDRDITPSHRHLKDRADEYIITDWRRAPQPPTPLKRPNP